jgi:hypothetical protein
MNKKVTVLDEFFEGLESGNPIVVGQMLNFGKKDQGNVREKGGGQRQILFTSRPYFFIFK